MGIWNRGTKKIGVIDIGTTKVCTIMGEVDKNNVLQVVGVGVAPAERFLGPYEAKALIRKLAEKAERTAGWKLKSASLGVPCRNITSVDRGGINAITSHLLERLPSVKNLITCVRGAGVGVDEVVLEPLAGAEAVLTKEERRAGVALVDIGGGYTDIAIFKDNSIYHTAVLPVAGRQVTKDISVNLGLEYELAEEMKKKYGNILPNEEPSDTDMTLTDDEHSVSYRHLNEIIRVRIEEILRLVMLELPHIDYDKLVPAGLVLTGGCANLPGIAELGAQVTRLPVRIGSPVGMGSGGRGEVLNDPAYTTSVGLMRWKMRHTH